MRSRLLVLVVFALTTVLSACASYDEAVNEGNGNHAEADAEHEGGDGDAGGDGASAADEHGAEGNERDGYSKPGEVYAFLEIGEGHRVVDVMAGGGYNAERLAHLVGGSGSVIAERASEEFQGRVLGDDAAEMGNIEFVGDLAELADGSVDAVVAVRAYHLFPDVPATLAELHRALAPGGVVGVVEVRLNATEGHDMETHRVGEDTVVADFEAAGFEYVGASDILRRDDDDYTVFALEGKPRFMTDRMLLKFRKPAGD